MHVDRVQKQRVLSAADKVSFFTPRQTNWLLKIKLHQSSWKQNIGQLKMSEFEFLARKFKLQSYFKYSETGFKK